MKDRNYESEEGWKKERRGDEKARKDKKQAERKTKKRRVLKYKKLVWTHIDRVLLVRRYPVDLSVNCGNEEFTEISCRKRGTVSRGLYKTKFPYRKSK